MKVTLAFDVYGTLIDTAGIAVELEHLVGKQSAMFAERWRDKQLEYSFRKGLMQDYQNFAVCTKQALDFTDAQLNTDLSSSAKTILLEKYQHLPTFYEVNSSLESLQNLDVQMYAFSNGSADKVIDLLKNAEIFDYFIDVVSTDEIKTFKPNPAVYSHFVKRAKTTPQNSWLISSNPFDVLGGLNIGMQCAWLQRSPAAVFDPWERKPSTIIHSLNEIKTII